jgi:hypothetical protein
VVTRLGDTVIFLGELAESGLLAGVPETILSSFIEVGTAPILPSTLSCKLVSDSPQADTQQARCKPEVRACDTTICHSSSSFGIFSQFVSIK